MKTYLVTCLPILFLFPQWTNGQIPDKVIAVDFQNLKSSYEETIDHNTTFSVHLKNINRNLYKINGIKTETYYNAAVPTMLTGIKIPSYLYQASSGISMADSSFKTRSSSLYQQLSQIQSFFEAIKLTAKTLDNSIFLYNDLAHLSKSCKTHSQIVSDAVNSVKLYHQGANGSVSEIRTQLEQYLLKQRTDAINAFQRAVIAVDKYEKELQKDIDSDPKINEDAAKVIERLRENLSKAEATIEEMRKFEKDDKVFILLRLFDMLQAPGTFEYTSEIIKVKTDEVKYTITIEPSELNLCAVNSKKVIEITVIAKSGLKLDFSTGIFVSGGSNDFLGQTYYYEGIDADNRMIRAAERTNRNMLSIGALMHLYKRSTDVIKWGGSVGVSTTASFTDLNFHAGPSLFICNKNRIVLTSGLALRSSNLLDNRFKVGQSYLKTKTPDAIPTVTQFPMAGYFFSLTYNFSKLPAK